MTSIVDSIGGEGNRQGAKNAKKGKRHLVALAILASLAVSKKVMDCVRRALSGRATVKGSGVVTAHNSESLYLLSNVVQSSAC
jgi:hypothetical protein